jgi:hypothetical protein
MPCPICRRGCGCSPAEPGCGHYGCFGRDRPADCPGVAAEERRYAALLAARARARRRQWVARSRVSARFAAVAAATAYGLPGRA